MLKVLETVKSLEDRAAFALPELVANVPAVRLKEIQLDPRLPDRGVDIVQLSNDRAHFGSDAIAMFIAPYLSPEAQALCRENDVAYLDLAGNARLA